MANKKSTETDSIRYYKGIVRDQAARIKNLEARLVKIENKLKNIGFNTSYEPDAINDLFNDLQEDRKFQNTEYGTPVTGTGLTEDDVKALIIEWLNNGELPISLHDHTDESKGGDAYANLGASLQ